MLLENCSLLESLALATEMYYFGRKAVDADIVAFM
jgi:hypothetical protein